MLEHRQAPRSRRLKEARLVFNDRKSVMSCVVRDMTEERARLRTGEPYLVPASFDFAMAGEASRPARKVWQTQNEMGISFKL